MNKVQSPVKADLSSQTVALDQLLAATPDLAKRIGIIRAAVPGRIAFSTSLGLEDQAVLHAIAESGSLIDVFTLDTGRHFAETLETVAASEQRYGLTIRLVTPDAAETEVLTTRDGVLGFRNSIDARKACCDVRKVRPLNKALAGASGWITGLRREQAASRKTVAFAEFDVGLGLVKLNPMADWTLAQLDAFITEHSIPVNALHVQGFPSIGCAPCTRAIRPGEDIRAGRWWWEQDDFAHKECGLHNRAVKAAPAPEIRS